MQVNIISKLPDNPINYIAENARICYGRESFNENLDFNNNKDLTTVESLLNKGHHSVFECIYIEWYVRNISRAATHQIVRHRMASYLQQSQRYCKYDYESSDGFWENMVIPDLDYLGYEDKLHDALIELNDIINNIKNAYKELIKLGVKPEDARCILPNCSPTTIKIGMNLREFLFNFYPLRTSKHAQAEISKLANEMILTLREKYHDDLPFINFLTTYFEWLQKQNRPEWK
jgi:thymidylate synthase (FAD)